MKQETNYLDIRDKIKESFPRSEGWHQVAFRVQNGDPHYTENEVKNLLSKNRPELYEFGPFRAFKRRCRIYYRIKPML